MLGDRNAHDLPAIVGQDDHHIEQPKRGGRHNEHVDGSDAFDVIAKESPPVLRRRSPVATKNCESAEKASVLRFTAVKSPACSHSGIRSFLYSPVDSVAGRFWN